jgi:hypothetical protein
MQKWTVIWITIQRFAMRCPILGHGLLREVVGGSVRGADGVCCRPLGDGEHGPGRGPSIIAAAAANWDATKAEPRALRLDFVDHQGRGQ